MKLLREQMKRQSVTEPDESTAKRRQTEKPNDNQVCLVLDTLAVIFQLLHRSRDPTSVSLALTCRYFHPLTHK